MSHMPTLVQPATSNGAVPTMTLANNNAGAVALGTAVYAVAAGAFDKALCSSLVFALVIGLVAQDQLPSGSKGPVQIGGVMTATTAQWDAIAGTSGGLTAGTVYYLDPTIAGNLTSTAPTATGKYVTRIGIALSTTDLCLGIQPAIGPLV